MKNNISIGFADYEVEVSFIIANADKVTDYGAVVAKHTQCIVTKNGLIIAFATVVKHAADKENPMYGCRMAMEKALANTELTKWERGEFWNIFNSNRYYDRFDPELSPTKFEPSKDDLLEFKNYLMHSIRKSIYSMPDGSDKPQPVLNGKGTPLSEGDEITTVGQLRYLMSELNDCDRLALECVDEVGDLKDHYPMI